MSDELILLVDDHPENLKVVANILRREGYKIALATSGQQALEGVKKKLPSLILLDIMMPGMDGYQVKQHLNEDPKTAEVPVIFLTALHDTESLTRGFDEGGVDYITKPFRTKELLRRVKTHLDLRRSTLLLEQKSNEQKELLHILCHDLGNPIGNIQSLSRLIKEEPEDALELVGLIEHTAGQSLEVIDLVRQMRALEEKPIELGPVPLKSAAVSSLKLLDSLIRNKQVTVNLDIPDELMVKAEPVGLVSSVINNLVSNAIKFSFEGGLIELQATEEGSQVVLDVTDHGVGMPEKLLGDLFDISKATSRSGTAGEMGTGFGMPLVKKFMTSYGGSIEVFSRDKQQHPEDHGTTVRLVFDSMQD